jgi:hypothetical protein
VPVLAFFDNNKKTQKTQNTEKHAYFQKLDENNTLSEKIEKSSFWLIFDSFLALFT